MRRGRIDAGVGAHVRRKRAPESPLERAFEQAYGLVDADNAIGAGSNVTGDLVKGDGLQSRLVVIVNGLVKRVVVAEDREAIASDIGLCVLARQQRRMRSRKNRKGIEKESSLQSHAASPRNLSREPAAAALACPEGRLSFLPTRTWSGEHVEGGRVRWVTRLMMQRGLSAR